MQKLGGSGTGAGLEPAPTDLRHGVLYQPITPEFVITSKFQRVVGKFMK